jgi:hypothetical protein
LEAETLAVIAAIKIDQNLLDEARGAAQRALAVYRDTGHRHGEARASMVLARVLRRRGRIDAAEALTDTAHALLTDLGAAPEAVHVPSTARRDDAGAADGH